MQIDRVWRNARLATMRANAAGLGVIERGAIASAAGRIVWCGPESELPRDWSIRDSIDCAGRWITPGLIDCHTHLVYAGDRATEFERRLAGESYASIAASGGGIRATVAATRAASDEQLVHESLERARALVADGVTTLEVKSGYGLDVATERRQLLAADELGRRLPVTIARTLLAAHALPAEAVAAPEQYIRMVCEDMIPRIARERLAEAVDAYCEHLAFSAAQVRQVFRAAQAHGLRVKLHADQLSNGGGAALAAEHNALSADHLEYTDDTGVAAMAASGTVAVMLPGAYYFLRERQRPPLVALRRAGVPLAVATDCNPGTSPLASLRVAMNMATICFELTVEECWLGVTRHAARALGLQAEVGALQVGTRCDLAIWEADSLAEPIQFIGKRLLHARVWRGDVTP